MTDNDQFPEEDNMDDSLVENLSNDFDDETEGDEDRSSQDIFEEKFHALMDPFGEACEKENIDIAISIATHPDHDRPLVFYRAPHIVDAATLLAKVLRDIKSQISQDLDTN
tara:strand:+ start:223 stop:555 length:333 start_codon:yes stop_codon:yes gene_type:complete